MRLPLRAKVFLLFAVTALLIVVPALLLIARAVERGVYERARDELDLAAASVQSQWDDRDLLLTVAARGNANDARIVEAWKAGNLARVQRILRQGLEKDIPFVIDSAGRFITQPQLSAEVMEAGTNGGSTIALPADSAAEPIQFALADVWADTVRLGRVGVGRRVSAKGIAKDVKRVNTLVVLMVGDSVVGTTLSDTARAQLSRADLRVLRNAPNAGARQVTAGERYYMAVPVNVAARGLPATVILMRPIADELQVANAIKTSLWGIGVAALILALVLAAVVARIVARPTQALAEASVRMARGDFSAPLPRIGPDEIGQLARAFGEMRRAIADREGRLRSAQAEMIHREKLAAMGRLVAQLSHEINNPIYNIQNCLEALERRGDPNDPNREFLVLAQEELARMASLTRRLLDQSRPQSDAASPLDLNALVHRVLTLAGAELRTRGIEIAAELGPDVPSVVAHPEAIQQVLANLVANAGDAMPDGGRLRVATRSVDDTVEVVVEDTGAGISERDLPHIFEAFYTTKPGVTGTGLGLFVSEGIIRGHRGRIDVESSPGKGSRFTIRLPRETLDETLAEAADARELLAAD